MRLLSVGVNITPSYIGLAMVRAGSKTKTNIVTLDSIQIPESTIDTPEAACTVVASELRDWLGAHAMPGESIVLGIADKTGYGFLAGAVASGITNQVTELIRANNYIYATENNIDSLNLVYPELEYKAQFLTWEELPSIQPALRVATWIKTGYLQ